MTRWLRTMGMLCLVLSILFVGCKKELTMEEGAGEDETVVSEQAYVPPPSPDGPLHVGTSIESSPFVGTFSTVYCALDATSADEIYSKEETPVITLKEDGSFILVLHDRDGLGLVTVEGTFAVDGENATFSVTSAPRDDYMGGDVTEFSMKLRDGNVLRYIGEQMASTVTGDLFERVTDEG